MLIGIRETNYQGLIFMVAKWVTYIPFVLAFMVIFFKEGRLIWDTCKYLYLEEYEL